MRLKQNSKRIASVRSDWSIYKKVNQKNMLTIASFLVGAWFLGLVLSFTAGGLIHVLLIVGVVIALAKIISEMSPADYAQ